MDNGKKRSTGCSAQSDLELWLQIKDKSCAVSFSCLFDRYWSILYSTAYSYLKDREMSEEITHDIFLNLWRKRESLDIQSFSAYLRAASRYHVYKQMKKQKNTAILYADQLIEPEGISVSNAGDEKIAYEEAANYINESLRTLPARCREIYSLSRIENLSNEEIADRLGISKRTVENQLTIALRHIRMQLKVISIGLLLCLMYL